LSHSRPSSDKYIQSTIGEYKSLYIFYKTKYLATLQKQYEEKFFRNLETVYSHFHYIAAYGNTRASKRIISSGFQDIYNLRNSLPIKYKQYS
jgi:hypothetical protein